MLFAASLLGAACGEEPPVVPDRPSPTATVPGSAAASSRSVIDMTGRQVGVPESVRSVAAMSPSAADFASALGLRVVGRTTDSPATVAPEAKLIGSSISPDFNAIAALAPDLVLADAAYHTGRVRDFERFAFPVFMLKVGSYPEVLAAITALGEATGHPAEAAAARATVEARANAATAAARVRATPSQTLNVLILTGGGRDVFAGSSSSYLGSLVELLGGANVLPSATDGGPIPGFGVVDVSQAATLKPDVVLILPSGQGGLAAQIRADKAWAATSAVARGRIHDLDTGLFLRAPGPRVGEALEVLFKLLWP